MRSSTTIFKIVGKSKKAVLTSVVSLTFGISLVLAPPASALNINGPSDCDNNAIIRCGVHSTSAVVSAYQGSAYVRAVYASFGISQADISNLVNTNVAGRVTKDGNVFIDSQSQAVANNAVTGGRQNIAGSTPVNAQGAVFYRRPPSVSFQQQSLPAFVAMKNGQFQFAIIASCGNAVKATPIGTVHAAVAPARAVSQAKPQPQPTPTQQQQQSQQVNVNNTNINVQEVKSSHKSPPTAQPQVTTPASQPAAQQTTSQPTSLVNTGPTGLASAFLVSSIAGIFGFRRLILHKVNNQ